MFIIHLSINGLKKDDTNYIPSGDYLVIKSSTPFELILCYAAESFYLVKVKDFMQCFDRGLMKIIHDSYS